MGSIPSDVWTRSGSLDALKHTKQRGTQEKEKGQKPRRREKKRKSKAKKEEKIKKRKKRKKQERRERHKKKEIRRETFCVDLGSNCGPTRLKAAAVTNRPNRAVLRGP